MKTYVIPVIRTANGSISVEANSEQEAIAKAKLQFAQGELNIVFDDCYTKILYEEVSE